MQAAPNSNYFVNNDLISRNKKVKEKKVRKKERKSNIKVLEFTCTFYSQIFFRKKLLLQVKMFCV